MSRAFVFKFKLNFYPEISKLILITTQILLACDVLKFVLLHGMWRLFASLYEVSALAFPGKVALESYLVLWVFFYLVKC